MFSSQMIYSALIRDRSQRPLWTRSIAINLPQAADGSWIGDLDRQLIKLKDSKSESSDRIVC